MKRIDRILAKCIDDIRSGKTNLADCLDRYPDVCNELEPLLRIALSIKEPADIRPSDEFKVRARVNLMEHIHASQSGKRAVRSTSQAGVKHGWHISWASAVAIAVAVILTISAAGTGAAYASQSSLPGDALYSVKLGTEQLQRVVTFDDAAEVELELKFASTRLDELEEIVSTSVNQTAMTTDRYDRILTMSIVNFTRGDAKKAYTAQSERISMAAAGYERNISLAINKAVEAGDDETSLERVALAVLNHLERIDRIEDLASEDTRGTISNFKEIAVNSHINALRNLAEVNPVRAAEINLQAMQGRLGRAEAEAAKGNGKDVENALREYERLRRFGEEISDSAGMRGQDTTAIDEMNARATNAHLETLGSIYGQVSQETKGAVEQAMGVAVEEHRQAVQGLQQQGAQGDIPTEPPLPDDVPDDVKKNIQGSGSKGSGNGRR
ncbi:MAG: hypothetical protein JSW38_13760 [Dehalococcoidia bacterium]|nr:MAG: hypothetical protein JSW38_13760 [Dehalococcoidia bacterium]